jgi:uncharacterized membrane protein YdbT with pleckstrin-like domain
MTFPRRLLGDHETVSVEVHPHWWFLAAPIGAVLASITAAVATLAWTSSATAGRSVAGWTSIVALVAGVAWLVVRYLRWVSTHFVVTNRRVIFRAGVVAKRGVEIPLERVNTVHFQQRILQRMVGAGDLLIESGGESGQQRFTDVRQPDRLQRVIHTEIEALRVVSAADAPDVAGQLERLEAMLMRGTLSVEEFERQKRRLLG